MHNLTSWIFLPLLQVRYMLSYHFQLQHIHLGQAVSPWQMLFLGVLLQTAKNYQWLENLMCPVLILCFNMKMNVLIQFLPWRISPYRGFMITLTHTHTHTHTTFSRTHWTSDQSDAETSTWQHKTLTKDTFMPPAEFEPTISDSDRLQTHTLDRMVTGINLYKWFQNCVPRSKGIHDPFLGDAWIHFCNGYIDIYLSLIKGIMFC